MIHILSSSSPKLSWACIKVIGRLIYLLYTFLLYVYYGTPEYWYPRQNLFKIKQFPVSEVWPKSNSSSKSCIQPKPLKGNHLNNKRVKISGSQHPTKGLKTSQLQEIYWGFTVSASTLSFLVLDVEHLKPKLAE